MQVREGFKGCTLPYSFDNRVLFVREGEFVSGMSGERQRGVESGIRGFFSGSAPGRGAVRRRARDEKGPADLAL